MNERIRCLREELGLSRAAFGQRIGVSGDVINNLESCRNAGKQEGRELHLDFKQRQIGRAHV